MRNTNGEVYVPSRLLKKAKSPLRHRVTESQRREGFRTYQKCQQILTLFVLIFLRVSASLWLRLVFHQPARGQASWLPRQERRSSSVEGRWKKSFPARQSSETACRPRRDFRAIRS